MYAASSVFSFQSDPNDPFDEGFSTNEWDDDIGADATRVALWDDVSSRVARLIADPPLCKVSFAELHTTAARRTVHDSLSFISIWMITAKVVARQTSTFSLLFVHTHTTVKLKFYLSSHASIFWDRCTFGGVVVGNHICIYISSIETVTNNKQIKITVMAAEYTLTTTDVAQGEE